MVSSRDSRVFNLLSTSKKPPELIDSGFYIFKIFGVIFLHSNLRINIDIRPIFANLLKKSNLARVRIKNRRLNSALALIILNMASPILVQSPYSIEGYQLKPAQVFADEYETACSINT